VFEARLLFVRPFIWGAVGANQFGCTFLSYVTACAAWYSRGGRIQRNVMPFYIELGSVRVQASQMRQIQLLSAGREGKRKQ
jgi:hypothetical protein